MYIYIYIQRERDRERERSRPWRAQLTLQQILAQSDAEALRMCSPYYLCLVCFMCRDGYTDRYLQFAPEPRKTRKTKTLLPRCTGPCDHTGWMAVLGGN